MSKVLVAVRIINDNLYQITMDRTPTATDFPFICVPANSCDAADRSLQKPVKERK